MIKTKDLVSFTIWEATFYVIIVLLIMMGFWVDSLETEAKYFVNACHQVGIEQINSAEDMSKLSSGNFYQGMIDMESLKKKIDAAMEIYSP